MKTTRKTNRAKTSQTAPKKAPKAGVKTSGAAKKASKAKPGAAKKTAPKGKKRTVKTYGAAAKKSPSKTLKSAKQGASAKKRAAPGATTGRRRKTTGKTAANAAPSRATKKAAVKNILKPSPREDVAAKAVPNKKLIAKDKRALRKLLLEMREHFSEQIEFLKSSSLERYDSVNSVEDGTDAFDRQFALTIAGSEQELLAEIDEALARLDEGEYGLCEGCGETISIPRLTALPFVKMCVKCQSRIEGGRRKRVALV